MRRGSERLGARSRRSAKLPTARVLVTASAMSYAANACLGILVATGTVRTGRAHWIHHAMYITTTTLTIAAVVAGGPGPARRLTPALVPLAAIPFVGTHTRRHPVTATAAAPFYLAALTGIWKK